MMLIVLMLAVVTLAMLAGRRMAWAAPRVQLRQGPGLPFTRVQLRRAVALRSPRPPRQAEVLVRTFGRRSVVIQRLSGHRDARPDGPRRIVSMLGLRGRAAARRVALAIYDLVQAPVAPASPPAPSKAQATVAAALALLASQPASAAPLAATASAEVRHFAKEGRLFIQTGRGFRRTLRRLVARAYQTRKRALLATANKRIRLREAEVQLQRVAAIAAFEDFLRRHPAQPRWTPDAMLRLAELYFEKANDEYLAAVDRQLARPPGVGPQAQPDYRRSVELYRRVIKRYPGHRGVDSAIYLLGFCLAEMERPAEARQAFLALICANRHRPPLGQAPAPAPAAPAPAREVLASRVPPPRRKPTLDTMVYDGCKARPGAKRLTPEAWIRVGEQHFDERKLGPAIAAYARVLRHGVKGNRFHGPALYKMAWTYYQADRFTEAIASFDRLLLLTERGSGGDMRPESIQYLAVCFTDDDWDNDGTPDAVRTVQRMETFYAGRWRQRHVFDVYRRVADTLLDVARPREAARLYRLALGRWPLHAKAPLLQDRLITALTRQDRHDEALLERMAMATKFGAGSAWDRRHRADAAARKRVNVLARQALLQSAVALHTRARGHREAAVTGRSPALLERARKGYAHAAATYMRYLELSPPRAMSVRMALGDCLFYSRQLAWAARAYARVRDGAADQRLRQEAAFAAAKALELQVTAAGLRLPPLPPARAGQAGRAGALPGAVRDWQAALDTYVRLFPRRPRAATLAYKAAELSLRYRRLDDARRRYVAIYRRHCKEPISMAAGNAILTIGVLQNDERRTETWAVRLRSKKCGGGAAVAARTAREARVLHDGLKLKRAMRMLTAGKHRQSARAFLAAAEGALRPEDAVTALINGGVAMERDKRYASSAAVFERAFARQKTGKQAGQALWRAAQAHERAGHFKQATARYMLLATARAFSAHKRRLQSTLNAALLLEKDKQHGKAAALLLRFARLAPEADRAAAAQLRAARCLQLAGDLRGMARALRTFVKRHDRDASQGPRTVEALARLGLDAASRKRRRAARRYLRQSVARFRARGLPAAGHGAEWAARAAFALADHGLKRFRAQKMRGSISAVMRQKRRMERQAVTLRKQYVQLYAYRRARWSLGATFRRGEVLEHLARAVDAAIRAIPVPAAIRRLGPDAVDAYLERLDKVLRQEVDPISDAARELYRTCLLSGRKLAVDNRFTRAALVKMRGYEPGKWPLPLQEKVERALK